MDKIIKQNHLNQNLFFIRNLVQPHQPKTTQKLDVYDPENRELILECREPNTNFFTKLSHFHDGISDTYGPFNLVAVNPKSREAVFRISRSSASFKFRSPKITIFNGSDRPIFTLQKDILSNKKYCLIDTERNKHIQVTLKYTHRGCELLFDGERAAIIVQQWKSRHADFFREGFSDVLCISENIHKDSILRLVLLAMAITIHHF
ncbi:MAG: hypothetical protein JXR23_08155 [Pontiellaceae bacterium]|nr:hypothetical protein [Pontiellaceae bacterium]